MQLEGADGAAATESDVISNNAAKESATDMETEQTDVGQKRMSNEMESAGGEAQAPSKSNGADADAEKDEDKGDGEGGADDTTGIFPAARVKRIMRKNPDKKKNFAKDTIHVVALATVGTQMSDFFWCLYSPPPAHISYVCANVGFGRSSFCKT